MKVYYFGKELKGPLEKVDHVNKEWRHAGFIVDDPQHGLVKFEVHFNTDRSMEVRYKSIFDYYARQHGNNIRRKDKWVYQMGNTNLTLDNIIDLTNQWVSNHPTYEAFGDNCREYADFMFRELLGKNGTLFSGEIPYVNHKGRQKSHHVHINQKRFQESPCEEAEHRLHDEGPNVPTCLRSQYKNTVPLSEDSIAIGTAHSCGFFGLCFISDEASGAQNDAPLSDTEHLNNFEFDPEKEKIGLALFAEAKLSHDKEKFVRAFHYLKGTTDNNVLDVLKECYQKILSHTKHETREIWLEVGQSKLAPVLHQDYNLTLDLMRVELNVIKKLEELAQSDHQEQVAQLKADVDLLMRQAEHALFKQELLKANDRLLKTNALHLGLDLLFDGIAYFNGGSDKEHWSKQYEADIQTAQQVTGHAMRLFEQQQAIFINNLPRAMAGARDAILQQLSESGHGEQIGQVLESHEPLVPTENPSAELDWESVYLIARITSCGIDFLNRKIMDYFTRAETDLLEKISHATSDEEKHKLTQQLMDIKRTRENSWGMYFLEKSAQINVFLSSVLDVWAVVSSSHQMISGILDATAGLGAIANSILGFAVRTPTIANVLLDKPDGINPVSVNETRLFVGLFLQNVSRDPISRYTSMHGNTILKLAARAATAVFQDSAVAATCLSGMQVLQFIYIADLLYNAYITYTQTLPNELAQRKIHNLKIAIQEISEEIKNNQLDPARLKQAQKDLGALHYQLKEHAKFVSNTFPALRKLYITSLYFEHFHLEKLENKTVAGDGNCLFSAISYYTKENAQELRQQAIAYEEANPARFSGFIADGSLQSHIEALKRGGNAVDQKTWGGQIEIVALSDVLKRPIIICYKDQGINLDAQGYRNVDMNFYINPIFVFFDSDAQHYSGSLVRGEVYLEGTYQIRLIEQERCFSQTIQVHQHQQEELQRNYDEPLRLIALLAQQSVGTDVADAQAVVTINLLKLKLADMKKGAGTGISRDQFFQPAANEEQRSEATEQLQYAGVMAVGS